MAKGYLHIVANQPGDIFINNEYRGTKDVNIELEQGMYTVTFGNVAGYTTPSQLSVAIKPEFTALITVEYKK